MIQDTYNKFTSPGIGTTEPPEFYSGISSVYQELLEKEDKTDLDKLDLFLLQLACHKKVGIRRKIVALNKFLKAI